MSGTVLGQPNNTPIDPGPPPGDYPTGVVTLGLQAVWNLQTTAGPRATPTKIVGVTSLPSGAIIGDVNGVLGLKFTSGSPAMNGWKSTDYPWYSNATVAASATDCLIEFTHDPGGAYNVWLDTPGAPVFNAAYTDIDLGAYHSSVVGIVIGDGGTFNTSFCRIWNGGINLFTRVTGHTNLTDTVLGSFGQAFQSMDHVDGWHAFSGAGVTHTMLRVLWKGDWPNPNPVNPASKMTGVLFPENNGVTLNVTSSIFDMRAFIGMLVQFQGSALQINFVNCAISSGVSAYAAWGAGTVVTSSGCVDLVTGVNIDNQLRT